ncbi:olfactory receptor 2W1-like [Ovis aries]|uniref:olfactory receptor 2W1-like n=1 Tax=Ovis aries TaxID=9940 RepID=UPI001C2E5F48|nr:olfactory receptor 2W1-like [Ovis aries]
MVNDSYFGFPGRPQLEMIISEVVFFFYTIALIGNIAIILLPLLDERLQIPMYFFLRNLAILDLFYTTNIVPQMLVNVWGKDKKISFSGCAFQLFIDVTLCTVECMLLAVMSYDRFNAVCKPLHYMTIMNPQLCRGLVTMTWIIGIINCMILSTYAMSLPRCENHHLDHYFCEISAMVKIACVDTTVMEEILFALCFLIFLPRLLLILVSYSFIAVAVLKSKSAAGRQKAFGTCSSHLIVVSIFYGTVIYMYIQPGNSPSQDEGKLLSIFYSIVTLSLNPLLYQFSSIHTLRNKEFKGVMKRLIRKEKLSGETIGH